MNKSAFAALMAVADPAKITFGTDYPFAPAPAGVMNAKALDQIVSDDKLQGAIARGNAARLLNRI